MILKLGSREWLKRIETIYPTVTSDMLSNAEMEVEANDDTINHDYRHDIIKSADKQGINVPNNIEVYYCPSDGFYYSTLMTVECERLNTAAPFDINDVLSFMDGGK